MGQLWPLSLVLRGICVSSHTHMQPACVATLLVSPGCHLKKVKDNSSQQYHREWSPYPWTLAQSSPLTVGGASRSLASVLCGGYSALDIREIHDREIETTAVFCPLAGRDNSCLHPSREFQSLHKMLPPPDINLHSPGHSCLPARRHCDIICFWAARRGDLKVSVSVSRQGIEASFH